MDPDPIPFFSDFQGCKKIIFFNVFLILLTGTLSLVLKIKVFAEILC
jgi:hypothetical protein